MNKISNINSYNLLSTIILGIALILASSIIGAYLFKSRQTARFITVKGLAEREVNANLGIWPISFRIADDDLSILQQKLEKQRKLITDFLTNQGFKPEELTYGIPGIEDKEARTYGAERKFRYVGQATITVRSNNVAVLEQTLQKSEALVAKGIVLDSERWEYRPQFLFTNLNEIKPAMIQEATIEARKAAGQFAKDSGSQVGNIRQATQGLFSIEDTHIPTKKHVRVVTTVQYTLIDK
jgi:hypothetical protein